MAKASPLNYSGNQNDEEGIPDVRTMKDGGAPSDFDKLQQQPFGAGALAPGRASGGARGNDASEPLPGNPPGFPQSFAPMGKDNPFAGIVAAHQQAQQQSGVADTRPMAQGGAPSDFDRLQQAPSQWQQLQQQQFGAGALSNQGTPTAKGRANDSGAGPSEPMPGPPPRQKPIDPTQPDMGSVPVGGSVIGQSPSNRSFSFNNTGGRMNNYAQDPMKDAPGKPMSDWEKLQQQPFGADSLANRAARPVGRSLRDHPERRIEMAERDAIANNDMAEAAHFAGIRMGLKTQQADMDYRQLRDHVMDDRHVQDQGAIDQRHQEDRRDRWDMHGMDAADRQRLQDEHWRQQMTVMGLNQSYDAMKEERARQQQELDRNRMPNVTSMPVPGNANYQIPVVDGRGQGVLPVPKPTQQGPTHEEIAKHIQDMKAKGVKAQHGKNGWTYEPQAQKPETVKVYDELNKKVVDWPAGYEIPSGLKPLKKTGEKSPTQQPNAATGTKSSSFLNF